MAVVELIVALCLATYLIAVAVALRRLLAMNSPIVEVAGKVSAILPLTGQAPHLSGLVRCLDDQTVAISELLISVESTDDPAYARARDVAATVKMPVGIVVAGLASDEGQKCRNQQAALEQACASTDFIVLLDADISPSRDWLQMLLSPLVTGEYDLVTGHRWHRIARHRLGAHLATAIDRGMTLLPRIGLAMPQIVWGGSIALSPVTALTMDLPDCLKGRLSDDLSIGIRASQRGLKVATRSALLISSPVDHDVVSAWRFGRRQYQIGKVYRPDLWFLALGGLCLRALGFGCALILAIWHQNPWPLVAFAVLGLSKQVLVAAVGARARLGDSASVRTVQYGLGVLQPLVDLFHLSIVVAAGWTRVIHWGHVTYDVEGPDHIRVIERRPYSS